MSKDYYYLEINITNKDIVDWGITTSPTLTGETNDPDRYRIFLTKGQYNKLIKHLGTPT